MKNFIIKILIFLHILKPEQVFLPYKSDFSDNKNVKYLFAFYFKDTKQIIPNTNIFIFYNITYAIYSLYLYCITYCRYDIELYCVGTINEKGIINTNIMPNCICNYFDGLYIYDDYKRQFGDVTDIPFNKIEDVIIEFIIRYVVNENTITDTPDFGDAKIEELFNKFNITSYDFNHFKEKLKLFNDNFNNNNNNLEV